MGAYTGRYLVLGASFAALLLIDVHVLAGERPRVDLSLDVTVSPRQFMPGSEHVVTLAVHNNGPDIAGAVLPDMTTIFVIEDQFYDADGGPPFEIRDPVVACRADKFLAEPNVSVSFVFFFGPIPPGESRTCTYGLEIYPWIVASFPTGWQVYTPNDDDSDPSNDRVDFLFQPAGEAPAAVSTFSRLGALLLVTSLLFVATLRWRRRFQL
jgi:hypothetical protein